MFSNLRQAMLVANRLLPEALAQRANWEVWLAGSVWLCLARREARALPRAALEDV